MPTLLEKKKAIQESIFTRPDGDIGEHTIDCLFRKHAKPTETYYGRFFGCDVIVAKPENVRLTDKPFHRIDGHEFAGSGTFTYPASDKSISIMVSEHKVLRQYPSKYWAGFPETVLYYKDDNTLGTMLVKNAYDLPAGVKWAIGGGDIVEDKTKVEGFRVFEHDGEKFDHSDVKRITAHCAIGFDRFGYVLYVYHPFCSLERFRYLCRQMGMYKGVFIDGGHIPTFITPDVKRNRYQKQGSSVRFLP